MSLLDAAVHNVAAAMCKCWLATTVFIKVVTMCVKVMDNVCACTWIGNNYVNYT